MPLYKSLCPASDIRVYIWKIEESESWLSRDVVLTPHCQRRVEGMQSELHRRGFLSIRHLMAEAGYRDADLYYDGNGKPHLTDGTHISITHSFEFTGIILSREHEVGIDIEKQRDKILRIAHRFTPIREYHSVANEEALVRKLTIIWGAKESLYKVMGVPGVSFLDHICVADFELGQQGTTARVMFHGKRTDFETFFLEFEGFTCVYALQQPTPAL
jgi:4'-phosphopantetheinyl transferase